MSAICEQKYLGKWVDTTGRTLVIKCEQGIIMVDFYSENSITPERDLLGGIKKEALNMPTFIDNNELVVELGTEGLGPTLRLKYDNRVECLLPTIEHGLYDEWEDDWGVPWIFPLQSAYYKTDWFCCK